jgi:hypothetical protein
MRFVALPLFINQQITKKRTATKRASEKSLSGNTYGAEEFKEEKQ